MIQSVRDRFFALLRRSERFVGIDMVYLASGGFWQTMGQLISALMALALILLFANFLPRETYGTFRYLISLAGLLNIFTLTGMNQAVTQAVSTGHEGVLRTAVRYQLKWNSLLMLAFLVLGGYYLVHENFGYTWALVVLGLAAPFTAALNTYGAYLAGLKKFRLNNLLSIASTFVYTAAMAAAIIWGGSVGWLVGTYAVAMLATTAGGYFYVLSRFRPPREESPETLKYGRHLTYIGLLEPVSSQLDSVLLNHFYGAAPLAVYSIAMAIPNRAVPFVKSWVDVGFPKIANKTVEEIHATFYKRIGQGVLAGAACAIGYSVLAPILFRYLLPQYLDAVFYTQILSLTFVVAIPNRYISTLLSSQKLSGHIFATSLVQNVARLLMVLVLGVWGGILGLVVARVASMTFNLFFNIYIWRAVRMSR